MFRPATLLRTVGHRVAFIIPCYNEEATIADVIAEAKSRLPTAEVYVYDNNSSDRTKECARAAGAIVREEPLQGKGNVVRRMFADVEADVFVMVDGDDTYDLSQVDLHVAQLIEENIDMLVGVRRHEDAASERRGHQFGNRLFNVVVRSLFGKGFTDIFSGYRIFSRRFVKSFPAVSGGFEIETELSIHALQLRLPVRELDVVYRLRPEGSTSKLRTFQDGARILWMIFLLLKEVRPLPLFGAVGAGCALISLGLIYPVLIEYFETGLVPRFPTAILSMGLMLLSFFSFACGFILDGVTRGRSEVKRVLYLASGLPVAMEPAKALPVAATTEPQGESKSWAG